MTYFVGDRGDVWERYEVDILASTSFQVLIEGTRGSSYFSDMAIDDVAFSAGCKKSSGLVTVTAPVTTPSTTVRPCGAGRFQ